MVNTLPAVLIGGPPHAGKSVLFYSLTHALRERGIRHHALRACPDGEGNWTQESDAETVSRVRIKIEGDWPDDYVKRICLDLEHRCLPLLVDVGGKPKESQMCILRQCTHSLLLLRADQPDYTRLWQGWTAESNLLPLAQIYSQLEGTSTLTGQTPFLEGTLTGLERNNTTLLTGQLFEALVERIAKLFNSYSPQELEKAFFGQAPTELIIDLYASLQALAPSTVRWEPEMLQPFLASLPGHTPLSVYGAGPLWVYGAVAAHSHQEALYQFDPRLPLGWIRPLPLSMSTDSTHSTEQFPEVVVHPRAYQDVTVLSIKIPSKHLNYFQPEPLPFPPVRTEVGLIIDGITPAWLLTSLVRLYQSTGVAWIAVYYPPRKKAIVVYSRVETQKPGDLVVMPDE